MTCWLVKADPDDYGFAELTRDGETAWGGVANALALRHLAAMRRGDRCFVYETGKVRAVVGTARVAAAARDGAPPRLAAGRPLGRPVTLAEIKADPFFADFALTRMPRLSVMPVTDAQWARIENMAKRA